jgi:O-antigen ligase
MRSHIAVAGFLLAVVATLVTAPGFGYDEARRPLIILGAALVLVAGGLTNIAPKRPQGREGGLLLASTIGLFTLAVSAVFAINRTQAVTALFPAIAAWIFLRGAALGWIPRAFLERHGLFSISIVGILFSGLGIDQALGWDALGIATDVRGVVHPVSTLGNTNYAGALSAVFAIVGLASVYFEKGWRRVPGVGAALLGALHVAASHSLGGLLGLAAGMVALTVLFARRYGWKPVALIPLALIVAGVIPAFGRTRDRVAAIARGEDRTAQVRLGLWRGTVKLAAAHPIVGCGTGNFQMEYPPYRDPGERRLTQLDNKVGYTEAADPHNTYLSALAESGPVALICLLSILGLAVAAGFRRARDAEPGAAQLAIAGGAGLVALAVSGMFNSLGGHLPFAVLAARRGFSRAPRSRGFPRTSTTATGAASPIPTSGWSTARRRSIRCRDIGRRASSSPAPGGPSGRRREASAPSCARSWRSTPTTWRR